MPIGAMISGVGLTVFKKLNYKAYPILGFILTAVALGLYTLMTPSSPNYVLVGNLILGGLAGGLTFMIPMIVAQNSVPTADVSTATSTLQFFQSIAGLLNIAIMQSYFNQQVSTLLPGGPTAMAMAEITAGVSPAQAQADVLVAYSKAVTSTFYISIAGALAGLLASLFLRWVPLSAANDAASSPAAPAHEAEGEKGGAPSSEVAVSVQG